jgi:hypothetical protein
MNSIYINTFVGGSVTPNGKQDAPAPEFLKTGRSPRIGVLINPKSGGNKNGLSEIRNTISDFPQGLQRDARTPEDVLAAVTDFAQQKVDLIAISGGDGTVQAVLTALFHHRPFETLPLLTILHAGTTSMIAGDVGVTGSRKRALQRLFHWSQTGEGYPLIVQRPVLKVQLPNQEIRYGMFFGAAGIYNGIQYCRRNMHTKGLRGELGPGLTLSRYLWAIARNSSEIVPSAPITVEMDQQPPQYQDCLVLIISTLERLFLGLHPFWGTETGSVHFTAVRSRPRHLFRALPSILRGRKGRYCTPDNGFFSHNVEELRLRLDAGFTLDGQMYAPESRQSSIVLQNGGQTLFLRL